MIKLYDNEIELSQVLNRQIQTYSEYEGIVRDILDNVIRRGDEAVLEYTRRFDCPTLESLKVTEEEIDGAMARISPDFLATLRQAKENITAYHKNQLTPGFRMEKEDGIVLGQRYTPIEKVGIYVPGGTAAYPSTVLMNAIPASLAGVDQIIMTTPCDKEGKIKDEILAAARLCGVTAIYKCGGAQAIAALAYGTQTVPAVHKIVGPGNIFVALAKRAVFGKVAIDMIAGPSEILILADKTANPTFLAADLLSQAEHDKLASAVLITDDRDLALKVQAELERQIPCLLRKEIARASIDQYGKIIVVENMERGVEIANEIAPEHLEICVEDPFAYLEKIRNAGSIFLGSYTPEPMGDYFAGPNHTLPTGGSAKFSSPLSVDDFRKKTAFSYYTREALSKVQASVADFAMREGLEAHAKSITVRFEENKK